MLMQHIVNPNTLKVLRINRIKWSKEDCQNRLRFEIPIVEEPIVQ